MRKYITLFFLLLFSLSIWAENASNVTARQEDKKIIISYDLSRKSNVRVYMSSNKRSQARLIEVTGDVGKGVRAGENREIIWEPLAEYNDFIESNVRFTVEAVDSYYEYSRYGQIKTLIVGQYGYSIVPQHSAGFMLGQMYDGMGWYINAKSNFRFNPSANFTCDKTGMVNGEVPFYTTQKRISHLTANVGFMWDLAEWYSLSQNRFNTFGFFAGAGFGMRELQLKTMDGYWDGYWVKYKPTSHTGFCGNLGVFGSLYGVTLTVGCSFINFMYLDWEVGIGYIF